MGLFSFFKKKKKPKPASDAVLDSRDFKEQNEQNEQKEPKSAWDAVMDSRDFKEQNELYDVMPEQNAISACTTDEMPNGIGESGIEAKKIVRPPITPK